MSCCLSEIFIWAGLVFIAYKILDRLVRVPRLGGLSNRYILVTGCDTGFGHEIAKRLDQKGCNVFAGCLTEKGETELTKACSSRLKTVPMNVANHDSVVKAYQQVKKMLPTGTGLWGIMNNAGIAGKIGPAEWLHLKDYDEVLGVNLKGLIDVTVTFLPLVKKTKGRIVNTASVFGRYALVGSYPYIISKYGVEAFSDSLRRQLREFSVSVHLIEPGFHKTNITDAMGLERSLRKSWAEAPTEVQQEYGEEYLEKAITQAIYEFMNQVASDRIFDVVDAYEHALLGYCPRARYVVGTDAKYVWLVLQAMPEWLGDWLLYKLNKNPPKPKALQ